MTQEHLFLSVRRVVKRVLRNRRASSQLERAILSEGEQVVADYPSLSFSGTSGLDVLLTRRIMNRLTAFPSWTDSA